jgi:hypothetical protein
MTALTRERDLLDAALIFGAGTVRGPSVTQSAAYIRPEGDNRVTRSFGPSERELIFFDDTDIAELTRDGAVTTHRIFSKFCRIAERSDFQEILQIAAAIRVGFHPSAERTDAVAHFVAVQEDIFNLGGRARFGEQTEIFTRRATALYCREPARMEVYQSIYRYLYRIRSRVLHGGDSDALLGELEGRMGANILQLLFSTSFVACNHLAFVAHRFGSIEKGMRQLITEDRLPQDPVALAKFQEQLEPDWLIEEMET